MEIFVNVICYIQFIGRKYNFQRCMRPHNESHPQPFLAEDGSILSYQRTRLHALLWLRNIEGLSHRETKRIERFLIKRQILGKENGTIWTERKLSLKSLLAKKFFKALSRSETPQSFEIKSYKHFIPNRLIFYFIFAN